jgi:hypothetical protein
MLAVLGACSVDLGKLRSPLHKDAAGSTDLSASPEDVANPNRDAAAPLDDSGETAAPPTWPDAQGEGGFDSGPIVADGAGIDRSAGTGDSADAGDSVDSSNSSDAEEGGRSRAESEPEVATGGVDVGVGDGNGPETTGNVTDSSTTDDGAVDVPGSGPEAADSGAGTDNAYGTDAANGDVAGDAGDDAFSVDARGKKICPTTISGSLDPSDATQIGRHSRYAPASACGTTKDFPGNGADTTYSHLYDAYHFINVDGAPVCFTFTLTYPGSQQLYAAAYSAFDPTNIARGYLGDVGGVLTSPQTMGITVGAGATIDVVVYATALGTAAAGSYTLSCSTD